MYTTSVAFFEAIWDAGVRYCFVNLGSDHPSIIEAMVTGQRKKDGRFPKIITCPNEMVALSLADGYARLTNKPQCVIVHVDVGTQALAAAVHNASAGRAPVLIFAGVTPITQEGEMRGSKGEYIHWCQDAHDQMAIVSQYCRYSAEIKAGQNVKQLVNRALSFATSGPKGPVYLCGSREVMEAEIKPYSLNQEYWNPVEPSALPPSGVKAIAEALANASEPLVITGYSGRNHEAVGELVKLADKIRGLRVLDTGGSDMSFPATHPAWLGMRFGADDSIRTADVILVLDCDVPWIPTQCRPKEGAKIYHVDSDPLKKQVRLFYIDALARYNADSQVALEQLNGYIDSSGLGQQLSTSLFDERWTMLQKSHEKKLAEISASAKLNEDGSFSASYLINRIRKACPKDTIWVIEAVTNTFQVADQIQADIPGSWINCGGAGLGWSGGGALGVKLATNDSDKPKFVCQIVGDGTYLFSVPSSVYWISQRYNIPILTIVLNNNGWNAPRRSLLLVHPEGEGSKVDNEEINISFAPSPDYAGIARAASGGRIWAGRASRVGELETRLDEAVESVLGGTSAVLDAQLDGSKGKYGEE
ncbi:thiamine pyrophosphate enzyme, N-terminal TPP binding domain-containing protein [Phyllosticta capitalensis]|uniref:Thiamine pyrophosphate enzyme, N-terminal TPP binding domain-containing protein n=1 Tax=Phyllosticta capitalensis TaxID=121624 RepID=A0ABR1Y9I9_9PEZI